MRSAVEIDRNLRPGPIATIMGCLGLRSVQALIIVIGPVIVR